MVIREESEHFDEQGEKEDGCVEEEAADEELPEECQVEEENPIVELLQKIGVGEAHLWKF